MDEVANGERLGQTGMSFGQETTCATTDMTFSQVPTRLKPPFVSIGP